jgi:hypothetical protein
MGDTRRVEWREHKEAVGFFSTERSVLVVVVVVVVGPVAAD